MIALPEVRFALDVLDAMVSEEAEAANRMAVAFPLDFKRIGAANGSGVRLQALIDARQRVLTEALRTFEDAA